MNYKNQRLKNLKEEKFMRALKNNMQGTSLDFKDVDILH